MSAVSGGSAVGTASGGAAVGAASGGAAVGAASCGSPVGTASGGSAVGTASCIYEGTISHRRRDPVRSFEHRIALFYVDLGELPRLLGGRLLARRPGMIRFRRRDYLGPDWLPLDVSVRDRVEEATGRRPAGPIRLLTQLRSFGHCFNPVSFYYCFDPAGDRVDALVAEVTNTPWGERHAYVLGAGDEPVTAAPSASGSGGVLTGEFGKALHVSPFMAMDHHYVLRAATPGERLAVHIESRRRGGSAFEATLALRAPAFESTLVLRAPAFEATLALRPPAFEATLALRRRELTARTAARVTRRYPVAGARVLGLIYGHALALKLAGATVYPHPGSGPRPHQLTDQEAH
ncbi:MAG: DUF1365 domain-containing protein [Solirubrobacterales bacterium]|nr:DUF1365 domain-containing protein [Solirubrobacterales bacterium]